VATTDFDITKAQTQMLLANGTAAAQAFVRAATASTDSTVDVTDAPAARV